MLNEMSFRNSNKIALKITLMTKNSQQHVYLQDYSGLFDHRQQPQKTIL